MRSLASKGKPCRAHFGQAMIESIVSMLALAVLLIGLATTFYFVYAKSMIGHVGYSGLICAAERQIPHKCEDWVRRKIKVYLPIGRLHYVKVKAHQSRFHISILWALASVHRIEYTKSLRY
jgi:hypothetical protein